MGQEAKSSSAVRFGIFEADIRAGELHRSGAKVKLQKQPFEVLAVLLERPGELVTREELRERIWPADTFVDFERGLNKAVNRLREALGDPTEDPKYIETLPRRGYRFIADVARKIASLAVLPLENLSGDPKQEYWADGLTDELITQIAKAADLRVTSRTSAMHFKGAGKPLLEIARELGVDALVEGSVVVSDQRVQIRAQLVDPFLDRHLWAESYERELGDVVRLQAQIAQAIARQVQARTTPAKQVSLSGKYRVNAEAYEAYLKGRHLMGSGTGVERSLGYFKRAITLDPDYAASYAGIADCYILLGVLYLRPPGEVFPKAREFAQRALERDGRIAEAHRSLGAIRNLYDWDWAGSEQELRRALELDPNLAGAHQSYAILLSCVRRYEEAIEEMRKARELDPLSLGTNAFVGFIHLRARQYDRAVEACQQAIELDPNNPFGHWLLARSLDAADRTGDALAEAKLTARLSRNRSPYSGHLGYAYARAGIRAGASRVLRYLRARQKAEYVSPYEFAIIYTALGEIDLAFEWMDKAYEERTPRLSGELWDRTFDGIRSDPRFRDLILRIGLPT